MKKHTKWMLFCLLLMAVSLSGFTAKAASASTLEVGEVRTLGKEVTVPITIHDTPFLTSGQMEVTVEAGSKGVTLKSFEPTGLFNNGTFKTVFHLKDNVATIDFIGEEQSLGKKSVVVGYLTYTLSDDFEAGNSVALPITNIVATGRAGATLTVTPLHGKIDNKRPIGDVTGDNRVDAADAMRILQHINGQLITTEEQLLSADIDADGVVTQEDAQRILDYVTGKRTSFLAIEAQELDNGVFKNDYYAKIDVRNGRSGYKFRRTGSLPVGLKLDEETGEITGAPTRVGKYAFTIQVTDAIGNTESRAFTMEVIDTDIIASEKIETINVKRGEVPELPAKVKVTYKDKTTGMEPVVWEKVDTSVLGKKTIKGAVGNQGYTIHVVVNVVDSTYITGVQVKIAQIMNLYMIQIQVHPEVSIVTINNIDTHYEGNNQFGLNSPSFAGQSMVTIRAFDKYGNLLETKTQSLLD